MTIEFFVQGSQPEPYRVLFSQEGDGVRASCTCAAGLAGQACKHRIELLEDPSPALEALIAGSRLGQALSEYRSAEAAAAKAKKAASDAKKKLGRVMIEG